MSKHVSGFVFSLCGRSCKGSVVRGTNQILYTRVVSACLGSLDHRMQFPTHSTEQGESDRRKLCLFFCRGSSSAQYVVHKALLWVARKICAYLHAYQCIHVCAYVAVVGKRALNRKDLTYCQNVLRLLHLLITLLFWEEVFESQQEVAGGICAPRYREWRYPVGMVILCLKLPDSCWSGEIPWNWNMKPITLVLTLPNSWIACTEVQTASSVSWAQHPVWWLYHSNRGCAGMRWL